MLPNVELAVPTAEDLELVELARETIDASTDAGPNEDGAHTMGAAVRDADGRMFAGVNLFHFTGGPCAELVALGAAGEQSRQSSIWVFTAAVLLDLAGVTGRSFSITTRVSGCCSRPPKAFGSPPLRP